MLNAITDRRRRRRLIAAASEEERLNDERDMMPLVVTERDTVIRLREEPRRGGVRMLCRHSINSYKFPPILNSHA